jgi:16S rRNA (cytosine1402-N4)-methyltransferase
VLPNVLPSRSPEAHVPVLAREVGALLDVHPGELIVDCTFGAGGHSRLLARELDGDGQLVAIDRDPSTQPYVDALRATLGTGVQVRPMHGPFATCLRCLLDDGAQAGAVLMDLGMSSMQVDEPSRGFSYTQDAPLDMRMDPSDEVTAATIVNEWDERELAQIFHRYGEERFSRPIARAIVQERARTPFTTTLQLVAVIKRAIPTPSRFGHGHPAKRVFQALRIAVNDELGQLEDGLESALALCQPGGRVAVIAFHSLEDRMVKQRFVASARGCICPPDLPVCGCGRTPEFRLVTSKAVRPSADEVAANPRAASARLRVVQRELTA